MKSATEAPHFLTFEDALLSMFLKSHKSATICLLIIGLDGCCINPNLWTDVESKFRHLKFRPLFSEHSDRARHMRWHMLPVIFGSKYRNVLGAEELEDLVCHHHGGFIDLEHRFILDWWKEGRDRRKQASNA